ncbi:MAG: type I restriction enzyme HsdR N-terminal domain-containing protein [Desulforegulaceae bacterium]|nr:type I restriction enzyme HsdR N-terminal domain-containing protein [Desulforegulaceae bacterium]
MDCIKDYLTGKEINLTGAEENRQKVMKFLVEEKGFLKSDIKARVEFEILISGEPYKTEIDLLILINKMIVAVFKTPAGSLSSWDREIISGARILLPDYQIPFAIVSDGENAEIFDTVKGEKIGRGIENIPSKEEIQNYLDKNPLTEFPKEKTERQKLVFKTYDELNINR